MKGSLSRANTSRCLLTITPQIRWVTGIGAAVVIATLCFGATLLDPTAADARVFVGVGFGFPIGFPGYYCPPYPYPYYLPPVFYPPSAYYPPSASYQPSAGYPPAGSTQTLPITYTPRPGWTSAQGQYCREYKSTQAVGSRATEKYGTACRDASGQWRIVN